MNDETPKKRSGGGKQHRAGQQHRGGRQQGGRGPNGGGGRSRSAAAAMAKSGSVQLPRWVKEALVRVTPKARVAGAVAALEEAAAAFVQGKHRRALQRAETAKALSPRDATVRELIGLSAYRLGRWDLALKELRTYRRLSGDGTHLPVEMDTLRALKRYDDVDEAWRLLGQVDVGPAAMKEGRVVYASHLLDRGRARDAWAVVSPKRLTPDPFEEDLRVWYVAARAAAALDDADAARRLRDAIAKNDPAFPGLQELDEAIGR